MCSCGRWGSECAVEAARKRRYVDTRPGHGVMGYSIEDLVNTQSHPDSREAESSDCEQ